MLRIPIRLSVSILAFVLCSPSQPKAQGSGTRLLAAGDTVLMSVDMLPSNPKLYEPGVDNYWNFRQLQAPFISPIFIRANANPAFDGQMVFANLSGVRYYLTSDAESQWITSMVVTTRGVDIVGRFDTPVPYRVGGLQLNESREYEGEAVFILPDELLKRLSDPTLAYAEAVRARVNWRHVVTADAEGRLESECGLYSAQRQRIDRKVRVVYEVRRSDEWQVVEIEQIIDLPTELQNGRAYKFWSKEEPSPLATVETDKRGNAGRVTFLASRNSGRRTLERPLTRPDILVHPNPSFGFVRFDMINLPPDIYEIEIYNIIGVELMSFEVIVDRPQLTSPKDLSELPRGTYIFRVVNSAGETICSKRLVIIQP